ncbi:hypothetical protein E2C01_042414 [Portunus trituberculatus]|uniref:Uncharacterized protein n=1 Tax=Portunus trituberculatus TaxID=210409 RepID=A0A5B7FQ60_PORTR|nr:hypothetical protein [Portunus trituberculatus]
MDTSHHSLQAPKYISIASLLSPYPAKSPPTYRYKHIQTRSPPRSLPNLFTTTTFPHSLHKKRKSDTYFFFAAIRLSDTYLWQARVSQRWSFCTEQDNPALALAQPPVLPFATYT